MTDRLAALHASEKQPLQLPLFGLPVLCCSCHRLKARNGRWSRRRIDQQWFPQTNFSHGICPACLRQVYPTAYRRRQAQRRPVAGANLFSA
jgi:hypothetical protein